MKLLNFQENKVSSLLWKELEEVLKKTKKSKASEEDYQQNNVSMKLATEKKITKFLQPHAKGRINFQELGDMMKVKNYRWIGLLNTCYKIFTKFIVKKISKITKDKPLDRESKWFPYRKSLYGYEIYNQISI